MQYKQVRAGGRVLPFEWVIPTSVRVDVGAGSTWPVAAAAAVAAATIT